jgi:hypothetical protein
MNPLLRSSALTASAFPRAVAISPLENSPSMLRDVLTTTSGSIAPSSSCCTVAIRSLTCGYVLCAADAPAETNAPAATPVRNAAKRTECKVGARIIASAAECCPVRGQSVDKTTIEAQKGSVFSQGIAIASPQTGQLAVLKATCAFAADGCWAGECCGARQRRLYSRILAQSWITHRRVLPAAPVPL